MQSIPTCSVADVAAAARAQGLSLEETVERAMDLAGRTAAERLYVGSSFCSQYFLRQPMSLWSEAFALCRQRGMAATLVVPVVSQRDLASACSLVEELLNSHGDMIDEVTVNDIGMFAHAATVRPPAQPGPPLLQGAARPRAMPTCSSVGTRSGFRRC